MTHSEKSDILVLGLQHGVEKIKTTTLLFIFLASFLIPLPVLAQDKPSPSPKPKRIIFKPTPPPIPEGLKPEKDTYVNSTYPNVNYGSQEKLDTGFTSTSKIMFLKFNLDDLELQEDEKVILYLWLDQSYGESKGIETEILLPNNDWEELELTWNNKPSLYSSGLEIVLEATPGAQKIDLTPLVQQWLKGEAENRGLAFYHNLESFSRTFFSRENKTHSPSLVIEKEEKAVQLAQNFFQTSVKENLEKLAFLRPQSRVKGVKTERSIYDYINQQSIIPLVGLWTASVAGFLAKLFKEYPLS